MSPADTPDAHLHENALAEDLTGASLLRTRIVENTEKPVSNAETRSETRSAAARPWTAPDAPEPARPSAKHASTRRPGAILRAAERLVLAAAVEDAAAGDANEGDGSREQPPVSDDTLEARFRGSDVFDALFAEKETDGETNLPAAKWWTSMVDLRLPEEALDLDGLNRAASPRTRLAATKGSETFAKRDAGPRSADARARTTKGGFRKPAAETLEAFASETERLGVDRTNRADADAETLARSLARLRIAVDGAKAKARVARARLSRLGMNPSRESRGDSDSDSDDARLRLALRGVGADLSRLADQSESAFATRMDARAAEARAALDARLARRARRDAPGDAPGDARDDAGSRDETTRVPAKPLSSPPGNALLKFNAQSRRTQPLRDFLVAHFEHPYPSDAQRERLARETGMSRAQVGNWFINARVRIWRPMILRLGEQIEDERAARAAAEGAEQGGRGARAKRRTNRTRARQGEARNDELLLAANAAPSRRAP